MYRAESLPQRNGLLGEEIEPLREETEENLPAFAYVGVRARVGARRARSGQGPVEWGRDDSRPVANA